MAHRVRIPPTARFPGQPAHARRRRRPGRPCWTGRGWRRSGATAGGPSPHWPGRCRFNPTCGAYGLTAVERHGLAVGGRMAAERVRRCRPRVPRGTHDPVR
ncbi:membrane protein insertion efficiency factor YidD [Micromonospora sp. URMC 107]|uniref:membrane protein insertion efficiency factor YidD n=1 Tax=Micromonospora sp. URMC 107 TaxID=3423418 RepID=UPI003F1DF7F0